MVCFNFFDSFSFSSITKEADAQPSERVTLVIISLGEIRKK